MHLRSRSFGPIMEQKTIEQKLMDQPKYEKGDAASRKAARDNWQVKQKGGAPRSFQHRGAQRSLVRNGIPPRH